jgi:hypothetical protein
MRRWILFLVAIAFLASCAASPPPNEVTIVTHIVKQKGAKIHSSPSNNAVIVSTLEEKEPLERIDTTTITSPYGEWIHVKDSRGKIGWILTNGISLLGQQVSAPTATTGSAPAKPNVLTAIQASTPVSTNTPAPPQPTVAVKPTIQPATATAVPNPPFIARPVQDGPDITASKPQPSSGIVVPGVSAILGSNCSQLTEGNLESCIGGKWTLNPPTSRNCTFSSTVEFKKGIIVFFNPNGSMQDYTGEYKYFDDKRLQVFMLKIPMIYEVSIGGGYLILKNSTSECNFSKKT